MDVDINYQVGFKVFETPLADASYSGSSDLMTMKFESPRNLIAYPYQIKEMTAVYQKEEGASDTNSRYDLSGSYSVTM